MGDYHYKDSLSANFKMSDNLKILLRGFVDFPNKELVKICNCFKPKTFRKNSILLREGDVCKELYFVQKGGIRTYFIDRNGYEKTRYIMLDNHMGTAMASFISQKPSVEFIEALEDTELLAINRKDFYLLCDQLENWKLFYQRILEKAYTFQNRKIETLVTLTAKQRYEQLLKETPLYVQRLSNKVLASYLDMREETLSRLKSG